MAVPGWLITVAVRPEEGGSGVVVVILSMSMYCWGIGRMYAGGMDKGFIEPAMSHHKRLSWFGMIVWGVGVGGGRADPGFSVAGHCAGEWTRFLARGAGIGIQTGVLLTFGERNLICVLRDDSIWALDMKLPKRGFSRDLYSI